MTNMLNRQNHNVNATNAPPARRAGFSLVEILVVMGILGILIVLIVTAISPLLGGARVAATQTTIAQINDVIQARYNAIKNADVSVEAKKLATLNSGLTEKDAEFLIRKVLYRQALPQRPEDLMGLDFDETTSADNAPYASTWFTATPNGLGGATSSNGEVALSAEILLFALTNGNSVRAIPEGKSYNVPVLELDNINQKHIRDTDGNSINELVDDWGKPFWFYNFPTRLIRPNGGSNTINIANAKILVAGLPADQTDTGPLGLDPFDPTGTLFNRLTNKFTGSVSLTFKPGSSGNTTDVAVFDASNYHDANTYYIPLLVSSGPDGATLSGPGSFGLGNPTSTSGGDRLCEVVDQDTGTSGIQLTNPSTNESPLLDNITNRQQ